MLLSDFQITQLMRQKIHTNKKSTDYDSNEELTQKPKQEGVVEDES